MALQRIPNGKTLLFIGGPSDAVPAIGRAWALGYQVYIVDGDENCPAFRWAQKMIERGDVSYAIASTYDSAAIIKAICGARVDGVLAVACDVAPIVSRMANELVCPHIPESITRLSWDKPALKKELKKGGISVPEDADFVVKPAFQGRGARGVKVLSASNVYSPRWLDDNIMFEQFVFGPQVSAEALVWEGDLFFAGYTDRDYSNGYPVEVGGWGPSEYESPVLCETIQQVVNVLGIQSGTIKLDIVLNKAGPVIIEAAIGRLSGGLMCSHYLPLAYNVDFLAAVFQVACGNPPDLFEFCHKSYYVRGRYKNGEVAKTHKERGRLKLKIGNSREVK